MRRPLPRPSNGIDVLEGLFCDVAASGFDQSESGIRAGSLADVGVYARGSASDDRDDQKEFQDLTHAVLPQEGYANECEPVRDEFDAAGKALLCYNNEACGRSSISVGG